MDRSHSGLVLAVLRLCCCCPLPACRKRCFFPLLAAMIASSALLSSSRSLHEDQVPPEMPAECRAWLGWGPLPAYPAGDCATQCSHSPAGSMRSCMADTSIGIPQTICKAVDGDPSVCPTYRYPDAVLPEVCNPATAFCAQAAAVMPL